MTQVPNFRPPRPHSSRLSRLSARRNRLRHEAETVTSRNSAISTDIATQLTSVVAAKGSGALIAALISGPPA